MRLLRKFMCLIGRHRYGLVCSLSSQSDLIACHDCKRRFAMNHGARILVLWDRELEKFYEETYWNFVPEERTNL